MDRTAVFIDAGYLFAAGSKLIASERLKRGELKLDHEAWLALMQRLTSELTQMPMLLIYWYDGAATGPTPDQLALSYQPNVKRRLGSLNMNGQQKGVDALMVTDLINLARNHAMADALLLTGDADIRVGVQQAQEFGVRVHLLGIEPSRENQSGLLVQEADTMREITKAEVETFLVASSKTPLAPTTEVNLHTLAEARARALTPEQMSAILIDSEGGSVPPEVDRELLRAGSEAIGGELSSIQKRQLRAAFIARCRVGAAR